MNRNTKKLEYIKKVWKDRDGPGKDERSANFSPKNQFDCTFADHMISGCVSMMASSITKEDIGPVQ